jgi:cytochrome c oxidase assembly factor CtaG
LDAFSYLYQHLEDRSQWLQAPISLDFVSSKWWRVIVRDEGTERWLHRRLLELCVFSNIAADLKAGDICVVDADDYADYREQLLPWEECPPLIEEHCQALGIPSTPEAFGKMVKAWLEKTAEEVDAAAHVS